ncbi:MAG: aspartate kinase [Bdellovibrio sp.]|nr:aspartate kinase [Bdellovibrio sp.]
MSLRVQKFGGTSVGTPERVRRVAERIAKAYRAGHSLVVVVSAMGHTTDELIDLAHQVSKNPSHREMDMLLTAGERISMALLSMALEDCKVPAISLTGSQTGIITDPSHRRARIRRILGSRVRAALEEKKVVIVAGFQGVSENKEITTLGRGGSDTSAVALAVAVGADLCEIFTDVDGVYTADPRCVPQAKLWKKIPQDLMVELATRGAGVLHPRSVELAKQFNIPLFVKNSLKEESEGTAVVSRSDLQKGSSKASAKESRKVESERGMEEFQVAGVTADLSKILIRIELTRPTTLPSLWEAAAKNHLSVIAPFFADGKVSFFSDRDGLVEWHKNLEHLSLSGFVDSYKIEKDWVPLSIVGDRFSQDGAALAQVIEVLGRENIVPLLGTSSSLALTMAVRSDQADEGVRLLHREFLEGQKDG